MNTGIEFAEKLSKAYSETCKPLCHELNIPQTAFDILLFLANNPEYKTARDIVEIRKIKANLVSVNVDKLVNEGYLERKSVEGDRRKVNLICTEKSKEIIQEGQKLQQSFVEKLFEGMDEDTRKALQKGMAHMGIGMASGEKRALEAAKQAVESSLLETSINGAKGVIINITGGADLGILEVSEAAAFIQEYADGDANIIWGAGTDEELGDAVRITVIATGFESADTRLNNRRNAVQQEPQQTVRSTGRVADDWRRKDEPSLPGSNAPKRNFWEEKRSKAPQYTSPLPDGEEVTPHFTKQDLPKGEYNPKEKSNLDLPSFLRNRND